MLFLKSYAYGKCIDLRPWLAGVSMILLGVVLLVRMMTLGS